MDESFILSEFDRLVNSGTVIYNDKEEIIERIDGGLNVCLTPCLNMDTYPQGA
jgi:ATP adenylyltransferase